MNQSAEQILRKAVELGCTDIFVVAGSEVMVRISGKIIPLETEKKDGVAGESAASAEGTSAFGGSRLTPEMTQKLIGEIYDMAGERSMDKLLESGDDDFSFSIRGFSRFRMNAYKQRNSLAAVIRVIAFEIPDADKMNIPESIIRLSDSNTGLILVTGPAGSGKSTTLACMVDAINRNRAANIVTLEDPIEYLHKHKKSIVSQREIHNDTLSYVNGLRSTLRQSPDVILLGEMRDYETISVAMTAAETGHLLLSTLHTIGAANTVNRIIDVFPADQQHQISVMLSMVLRAIVSQQLVPTVDGGMIPVFEVMTNTPAISNLIRSGKAYQIDSIIASQKDEMISMDAYLLKKYHEGILSKETVRKYAMNPETIERKL